MTGQHLSPVAVLVSVATFGFFLYRRYRQTVGRQALVPRRLMFQVGLLAVITLLFFVPLVSHPIVAAAALAGLLAGGLVAVGSLRLTRFERTPGRDFYTPNTYLGLSMFAVFLARIVYSFSRVSAQIGASPPAGPAPPGFTSSPLTAALLLMVFGYYLIYESGLLLWRRRNPPGQSIQA